MATFCATAQSLDRSVLASAGKEMTTANASMEFTLGEMSSSQLSGTGVLSIVIILNQGFNQGYSIGRVARTATGELEELKEEALAQEAVNFRIFPNPTTEMLNLEPNGDLDGTYSYKLMTLNGQEVYSGTVSHSENHLDMTTKPAGVYLLQISNDSGKKDQLYRIIKQ